MLCQIQYLVAYQCVCKYSSILTNAHHLPTGSLPVFVASFAQPSFSSLNLPLSAAFVSMPMKHLKKFHSLNNLQVHCSQAALAFVGFWFSSQYGVFPGVCNACLLHLSRYQSVQLFEYILLTTTLWHD